MTTDTLEGWFNNLRRNWQVLTQCSIWILNLIGGLILQPPVSRYADLSTGMPRSFSQFVVAITAGLVFVAIRIWNTRKDLTKWVFIAILSLIISICGVLFYQLLIDNWTCVFAGEQIVVGDEYSANGKQNVDKFGNQCTNLLWKVGGDAEVLWTAAELRRRRFILQLLYVSILPVFTICIIGVLQAISCSSKTDVGTIKKKFYSGDWSGKNERQRLELTIQSAGATFTGHAIFFTRSSMGEEPGKEIVDGPLAIVSPRWVNEGVQFRLDSRQRAVKYSMSLIDVNEASLTTAKAGSVDGDSVNQHHWQLFRKRVGLATALAPDNGGADKSEASRMAD